MQIRGLRGRRDWTRTKTLGVVPGPTGKSQSENGDSTSRFDPPEPAIIPRIIPRGPPTPPGALLAGPALDKLVANLLRSDALRRKISWTIRRRRKPSPKA